jgi:Uma2 family endonuclease
MRWRVPETFTIASRVLISLGRQLSQANCEAYNSATKIRIRQNERTYFYYPDAIVVCDSNPDEDTFQDQPLLIVEVVSESTRRIDEGEKRERYLSIEPLRTFVMLEQDQAAARVYARDDNNRFIESIYHGHQSVLKLACLDLTLELSELYAGIEPLG